MHILIANDDGYLAPGLLALVNALRPLGQVTVIAPEQNHSGASNSLTLSRPLTVTRVAGGERDNFLYVNGTPTDCVHIALTGLLGYRPDLVVSGINNGANMGDDTLYSGTVGAAMEGYLFGIPAMAVSQIEKGWAHVDAAAQKVKHLIAQMQSDDLLNAQPWLLNVNIPNLPFEKIRAPQLCRLGRRHAAEPVITQVDPRGQTMYWIGNAGPAMDDSEGTDFHAAKMGHMVVTPLKVDLTEHHTLDVWSRAFDRLHMSEST